MSDFAASHLSQLRRLVGPRLLLVPGARVVIQDADGWVLLQERADFRVWGLPGGNAEPGEDAVAGLVREVKEETGLDVSDLRPFGYASDPARETVVYPNGDRVQHFVLNVWTRSYAGTPRVGDGESLSLAWFGLDALPAMLPNMLASVEAFRRHQRSGRFELF